MEYTKDSTTPIFFDNLDIFAAQYVEEYDKLKQQYPWWSVETLMGVAKATTVEFLYFKLKEDLKTKPVWPEGFQNVKN